MPIPDVIGGREITEVLHFTTNRGVLGMFAMGALLPRRELPQEHYLEHVYKPNSPTRKDPAWTGHSSLSISRVNTEFFGVSRRWHSHTDTWWAIIAIDPSVLAHEDVMFVTTNNIYPRRRRSPGVDGLEAMFADEVLGRYDTRHTRQPGTPKSWTTDVQAEVLYPGRLSTRFVTCVYVVSNDHADLVASQYDILRGRGDATDTRLELPISVRPDLFE